MLEIKNYVRVQSLAEAYELCQNRSNVIIGGMLWLKMQNRSVDTAIDLCDLNLNHIEDKGDEIHIGAMVSLRELELNSILDQCLWLLMLMLNFIMVELFPFKSLRLCVQFLMFL